MINSNIKAIFIPSIRRFRMKLALTCYSFRLDVNDTTKKADALFRPFISFCFDCMVFSVKSISSIFLLVFLISLWKPYARLNSLQNQYSLNKLCDCYFNLWEKNWREKTINSKILFNWILYSYWFAQQKWVELIKMLQNKR